MALLRTLSIGSIWLRAHQNGSILVVATVHKELEPKNGAGLVAGIIERALVEHRNARGAVGIGVPLAYPTYPYGVVMYLDGVRVRNRMVTA